MDLHDSIYVYVKPWNGNFKTKKKLYINALKFYLNEFVFSIRILDE